MRGKIPPASRLRILKRQHTVHSDTTNRLLLYGTDETPAAWETIKRGQFSMILDPQSGSIGQVAVGGIPILEGTSPLTAKPPIHFDVRLVQG